MMLPLRIRKAEVALADGRLDDAYQQATQSDVQDHRKGQRLVTRLARAYEQRSQIHLDAGNPQAALADAERAARLGGNQPSIIVLRDNARGELRARQDALHARQQKLSAAKRCLAAGDYSVGAKLCQEIDGPGKTIVGLMQDAEVNRRIVEAVIERGRQAVKSSHWEQALDALDEAKRLQPMHRDVDGLFNDVTRGVGKQIRHALVKGRLDHVEMLLHRLQRHAPDSLEMQELSRALAQCRDAANATRTADLGVAIESLKLLKRAVPEARWLDGAIKESESAARSLESLRIGPLGSLSPRTTPVTETEAGQRPRSNPPMRVFDAEPVIPDHFLIHLDGAGSFLVLRSQQATIGPPSRSREVDVQLQGQLGLPAITIERMDEDYFLSSDEPVHVNGKRTTNTLLTSQDQIRLGRRGSIRFMVPNAASTSATLDFAGMRLANGNARRVILMDDTIIVGPQPSAHIQTASLERAMVIHLRNGEMRIRPLSRAVETPGARIAMGRPHDLDGLSLVVTPVAGVV